MPRQPRGKRSTTAEGNIEVVAENGPARPGYWRASYRDADGKRRTVSGPTRV